LHQFHQPSKLRIDAVIFPSIYEAAYDLEVAGLIVAIAIDAIERTQKFQIIMIAPELKLQAAYCAQSILGIEQRADVVLKIKVPKPDFLILYGSQLLLSVGPRGRVSRVHCHFGNAFLPTIKHNA
jgi:hypothetical protein